MIEINSNDIFLTVKEKINELNLNEINKDLEDDIIYTLYYDIVEDIFTILITENCLFISLCII